MIPFDSKDKLVAMLGKHQYAPAEVNDPDVRDNYWSIFQADLGGIKYPVACPCENNEGKVLGKWIVIVKRGRVNWVEITNALWVQLGRESKALWLPGEARCA